MISKINSRTVLSCAMFLSLLFAAPTISMAQIVTTTSQTGEVNIKNSSQCGQNNYNTTRQTGDVNINRTKQGNCDVKKGKGQKKKKTHYAGKNKSSKKGGKKKH